MAASRFAKRHHLPLVSIFHDWWPDMVAAHSPVRKILEREFGRLARESAAAFCVSDGMREALGSVPNAVILPPIPADTPIARPPHRNPSQPFKIVCSGNLSEYGPMLGDGLEESLRHPEILLQVRGANPAWSEEIKAKMRANDRWLDFAPRAELESWLASADAFLVPMAFDPAMRRRMETSFPSKLCEFARFGKPIVVWGPEYCSGIRWARGSENAFCVTNPDPVILGKTLLSLAMISPARQETILPVWHDFQPPRIQKIFWGNINNVMSRFSR